MRRGAPQRRVLSAEAGASGNTNRCAATARRLSPATAQPLSALIGAACGSRWVVRLCCAAVRAAVRLCGCAAVRLCVRLCGCAALRDGCRTGAGRVQDGCRMGAGWVQGGECGRGQVEVRLQKPQHVSRQGESERFPLHSFRHRPGRPGRGGVLGRGAGAGAEVVRWEQGWRGAL